MSTFEIIDELKSNLNLKIYHGGSFLEKQIQFPFNILHLNIQSFRNKVTKFTDFLLSSKNVFHVIVLSETHIKKDETQFFDLPGYKCSHCTREGRLSGGVSIFVRKDFSDFDVVHSIDFELNSSLLVELTRFKIKILGFYKYRNCNFTNFTNHLTKVLEENPHCIAVGDFNINLFKIATCSEARQYHDLIITSGHIFLNALSKATRIDKARNSETLIDHCFTDLPLIFPHYEFTFYLDDLFGDHKAFLISINTSSLPPPPPQKTVKITRTNHAAIQKDKVIEGLKFTDFNDFQEGLKKILGNYTKITIKKERFRKPFMNQEILTLMSIRHNYFALLKQFPWSTKASSRYRYYRNQVTSKVRAAKISFYDKRFQETSNNPKQFWRNVNNLLTNSDGKVDDSCKLLKIKETETTNRLAIANAFNHHFTTIASEIKNSITINPLHFELLHDQEEYFVHRPLRNEELETTELEVSTTISNLNNSYSQDINQFNNNLFKTHNKSLAPLISNLINKSIADGSFPPCLKIAKVSPLYKQVGSRKDPNNYRPVAENTIAGKCFEDILLDRLTTHLTKNNIINSNQFGFTKGSSTEIASIHLLSEIYNNIDKRKETAVVFIDLTKAFDSIDHEILLQKLRKIKIPNLLFNVLQSYLSDRKQFVSIEDVKSSLMSVTTGVFQGSKLASCLFIIYINNIFSLPLRGILILYADDIALVYGATDAITLKRWIEEDLILLNCWIENHFMKINLSKTKFIFFSGRAHNDSFIHNDINIDFNGSRIEKVDSFNYLGIKIDEKLNFKQHLASIRSRIVSTSFAIKRIRPFITLHTAKQIYFCRIQSLLLYLNSCWNVANKTEIENLGRTQRKVLRFIFQKKFDSPSKDLFSNKILPLTHLNSFQTCILTFKMVRGLLRSNVQVSVRREVTTRETRQSNDFYIPNNARSWAGRSDFFKRGFDEFNKLPLEIKKLRTVGKFKEELKAYLFGLYLES